MLQVGIKLTYKDSDSNLVLVYFNNINQIKVDIIRVEADLGKIVQNLRLDLCINITFNQLF